MNIKDTTSRVSVHCEHLGYMELILAICDDEVILGNITRPDVQKHLQQKKDNFRWYYSLFFKGNSGHIRNINFSDKRAVESLIVPALNRVTNNFMDLCGRDVLSRCVD